MRRNRRETANRQDCDLTCGTARGVRYDDLIIPGVSWLYVRDGIIRIRRRGNIRAEQLPLITEDGTPLDTDCERSVAARGDCSIGGLNSNYGPTVKATNKLLFVAAAFVMMTR